MKSIRLFLLALVVSLSLSAKASTNDYSNVLNSINQWLVNIHSLAYTIDDGVWTIQEMFDTLLEHSDAIYENTSGIPSAQWFANLINGISDIRRCVLLMEASITNNLDYLSAISYNVWNIDQTTQTMLDDISELDGLADSLQEIIDYASQVASDVSQINSGDIATETTLYDLYRKVQEIHGMLQSIDPTSILMEIDGHLEQFITNWQHLFDFLYSTQTTYFDVWQQFFYDYSLAHGFPTLAFRFYRLSGAPFFSDGFQPQTVPTSLNAGSMFDYLNYAIKSLLDVSVANNEISLFIAKSLTTNGQAEVLSDFQSYAQDIISDLQDDYATLRDIAYDNSSLTFNPSTMPLGNIKSLFDGLDSRSYSVMRSEAVIISGFNALDPQLPSTFSFQYDLTPMQSLIEIARVVFSTIWILLFCSMFLWMCFKFRRLYNWLFTTMVSNAPNQSGLTNIPI